MLRLRRGRVCETRFGKEVNGLLVQGFLYQDQLNPIAETDGTGDIVSLFVYGSRFNALDYIVSKKEDGVNWVTYRAVADQLGSPRAIVNEATGVAVQELEYNEFGRVLKDTNPGFQPFGFTGGLYDLETEFVRLGVRDYDAESGRWTAKDPIGFFGGLNISETETGLVRFGAVEYDVAMERWPAQDQIRFEDGNTNLFGYVFNDPINAMDPYGLTKIRCAVYCICFASVCMCWEITICTSGEWSSRLVGRHPKFLIWPNHPSRFAFAMECGDFWKLFEPKKHIR
jgi:RHS repeat-associated protein